LLDNTALKTQKTGTEEEIKLTFDTNLPRTRRRRGRGGALVCRQEKGLYATPTRSMVGSGQVRWGWGVQQGMVNRLVLSHTVTVQ